MTRIVGHLDLDYFYAQVEEVEDTSLKGKAVLVCVFSGRTEDSGVVGTANYRAREHGIRSGMPIAAAKRRLEGLDASFIRMDHQKYEEYSGRVMETLRGEVDTLEQTGIDEAFFEVTKKTKADYGAAPTLARQIKARVFEQERLTCSIGIGPNKVVAKIASDYLKPDGLTIVTENDAKAFLAPLSVEKIYGVGPKTAALLKQRNISTVSDLASTPIDSLDGLLGRRLATYLHNASIGIDEEPVVEASGATQLSRIITLKRDSDSADEIFSELQPALRDLHNRLVSKTLFFRSLSVLGVAKDLSLHTKGRTLETPTSDSVVIEKETKELLTELLSVVGELRRAGVRITGLQSMADQHSLTEFTG